MRIIGGRFRGKRLQTPKDQSIRPTSDRVRESLFNILEHHYSPNGLRFLDLFCGTGAVGLEAYSRGAIEVCLMDQDLSLARANLRAFGEPDIVRLQQQSLLEHGQPPALFNVAFLDPPYLKSLLEPTLELLREGWLVENAWVIAELAAKEAVQVPEGFFLRQERRYGRTRLIFLGLK